MDRSDVLVKEGRGRFCSCHSHNVSSLAHELGMAARLEGLCHRVIPLTVLRLVYVNRAVGSTDRTYEYFAAAVTTQVSMNVSIIATCVPFLKQFLDCIQPGWSASDTQTGLVYNTLVGRNETSYVMGSVIKAES